MSTKGQAEAKRVRAVKSLDLRIAGATYRQIGQQLAVSERTAYYDVQDELGRVDKVRLGKGERLRDLELARVEKATLGLWPAVQKGHPASVFAWVKLSERKAKLLGMDAPMTVRVEGPPPPFILTLIHHDQ